MSSRPCIVTLVWSVFWGGMIGFAALSLAVSDGHLSGLDQTLLLFFRDPHDVTDAWGPTWFEETAIELTALGGYPILLMTSFLVLSALLLARKYAAALLLVAGLASGSAASTALKLLFDRPRPDLVEHLDRTFTSSFPSAHAMVSMVTWLTLASIAIRFIEHGRLRGFVLVSALVLALIIGTSRVYLGVHWPSDVLAGWCIGLCWAAGCWLTAHYITNRPEQIGQLGHSS